MEKTTWNIQSMYDNEDVLLSDIQTVKDIATKLEKLAEDPKKNLSVILEYLEEGAQLAEETLVYTAMKQDEDSRVAQAQKMNKLATQAYSAFSSALSFLSPFLLGESDEYRESLLADASLSRYHRYLSEIFRYKEHTLSKDEEYILAELRFAGRAPSDIYYYLTNADFKFPKLSSGEELTNSSFVETQRRDDRELRKEAFEKYYETYDAFGNTFASSYYNNVRYLTTMAKLRKHGGARKMELFADDVDTKVYDALLESIHRNMALMHRYYKKKKELLELNEQHMYDVYVPLLRENTKKYTFEEAKELCIASIKVLGPEYEAIYRSAFEDGWIDVYPREGKRSGAYSSGSYTSNPYILMNFDGTLNSVFTLAHEMGHSMHSYYAKHNNAYLDYSYTIFAAEVASTFNENLLLHELKKRAETDDERMVLLDHHLDSFKSTVYRQTMFAEFEKTVHEKVEQGQPLTKEDFDSIYLDLNKAYFGDSMLSDPLIAHEWMRIPHFYRDFYVYKYATGYCAATVLAEGVLSGDEEKREAYFAFLKNGAKLFPIEQLKLAGCDMEDPKTVDTALEVFEQLILELEGKKEL